LATEESTVSCRWPPLVSLQPQSAASISNIETRTQNLMATAQKYITAEAIWLC
jgi:hypothetical protein